MKALQGLIHLGFQSNISYLSVSHRMMIVSIPSNNNK